jgi:hypothetical protein
MKDRGNPFVAEGMRVYLSERGILRTYLFIAGALGLAVLAMWPRSTIEAALRGGGAADTFTVVAACFLLFLLYLGARYGAEDYSADSTVQLREYVTLTPVPLFSVIGGRLMFAVLHTFLLLLIGAPFLAAAMAVGGAGFPQALAALAVIGAASLAARMCGLLVLTLVGGRRPLRDLLLIPVLAASLVVTFFLAPRTNPFHAIAFLLKDADGPSACLASAGVDLGAALALAACSLGVLSMVRGRAHRRGGSGE